MRTTKGLSSNTALRDMTPGYYPHAKNGIKHHVSGVDMNEPGFVKIPASIPYQVNGFIETPEYTFFFSTDNTNSAISRFNGTAVEVLVDDKNTPFKFNFKRNKPIKGEATKNFKDQWILCYKDELNPMGYINTEYPVRESIEDYYLFPIWNLPELTVQTGNGGSLAKGAYIPFIQYGNNDGTITPFVTFGTVSYINGILNTNSGSMVLSLTDLDTTYDWFKLGFIITVKGTTTSWLTEKQSCQTTKTVVVNELTNQLDNGELLQVSPNYSTCTAITQLDDRLILGGLAERPNENIQSLVNQITVRIKSQLVASSSTDCSPQLLSTNKTLLHNEVYALYFVGIKGGRRTTSFHVPGLAPTSVQNAVVSVDSCFTNVKRFQVEDTCSLSNGLIIPGAWENETEVYPNWSGLPTGKVRHFKMPSIAWCKENLYASVVDYGSKQLDQLGLQVTIPQSLKSKFDSWEIHYAKRTVNNMTMFGQSLTLFNSRSSTSTIYQSTGGNFGNNWGSGDNYLRTESLRFNSPDIQYFKPVLKDAILYNHLFLRKTIVPARDDLKYSTSDSDERIKDYMRGITYVLDYTVNTTVRKVANTEKRFILNKGKYVPHNAYIDDVDNRATEGAYVANIKGDTTFINALHSTINPEFIRRDGNNFNGPDYEQAFLSSVGVIKKNLYSLFYQQDTVIFGGSTNDLTLIAFDGDAFVSTYSFLSFGVREPNDFNPLEGHRFVHRFIGEHTINVDLRDQDELQDTTKYYPASTGSWVTDVSRDINPNQWIYGRELHSQNSYHLTVPYNGDEDIITTYPYRWIVSSQQSKEDNIVGWRTFLVNDYAESDKSKGAIVDLVGQSGRLLIKQKYGSFVTPQPMRINADGGEVYLRSVDLMSDRAQEVFADKAGGSLINSYEYSTYDCPMGHIWVDDRNKIVWMWKNELKNLNNEMNLFFQEFLTPHDDNPFSDSGYSFGWDGQYKRLFMTMKGENGFTLSYSLLNDDWVYFHEFSPTAYFRIQEKLFSLKGNVIFQHNVGEYGKYYDDTSHSFSIDCVFRDEREFTLNAVGVRTETFKGDSKKEFETFDKFMVYNNHQCSGIKAITVDDVNVRKLKTFFWLNDFDDSLKTRDTPFLQSLAKGLELIPTAIEQKSYWNKSLFQEQFAVVRLIYENKTNSTIHLHELSANLAETYR